jgi:phenylacetate-coenzyme A ligase PaaK-like adenylate-forming protein
MTVHCHERLRDLLEHARSQTVWYARLLAPQTSADPAGVLARLPVLTRQDLRREGPRLQARQGDTRSWRLVRTTGTTGEPAEVILDAEARAAEALSLAEHIRRCLGSDDWRERDLVHLTLHAGAGSRALPSSWHAQARVVKWNLLQAWQAGDVSFARVLAHVGGRVVTALPSVAELLAGRLTRAGQGPVRPLLVLLSGETVEPETRAGVAEALGCPVSTLYTLAEAGIVGSECLTDGGYHVEDSAWVEILDEDGWPAAPGRDGDVVVTPLANRATVLLRYRTDDRGHWVAELCRCGRTAPRLRLTGARCRSRLLTATGATVNVVRFAKLLAGLGVDRWAFGQDAAGTVRVSYLAGGVLSPAAVALIQAAVRAALGPETAVGLAASAAPGGELRARGAAAAEPAGPDPTALVRWLRVELGNEPGLEAAVLTGSALDVEAATRFSDVDLLLLVRGDVADPHWVELARRLHQRVSRLSVTVDQRDGLERRAPLLTCRLRCEQALVIGRLDEEVLPWPSRANLLAQAQFWAQDAAAAVWHQLTSPDLAARDPLRQAALASKYSLDALRYRFLLRGVRATAARRIVELARNDPDLDPAAVGDFLEAFAVAREHCPPPLGPEAAARYLAAGLHHVRLASAE